VHRDPQRFDLPAEDRPAELVHLQRHQPGGVLDDVRLEAEVAERVGRLEPQQPAAHHRADVHLLRIGGDGLEVLDGAVDEAAPVLPPLDRRDEWVRPGGQHQLVVGHLSTRAGAHQLAARIDLRGGLPEQHLDAGPPVDLGIGHHQIADRLAVEEAGEVHAVIGQPRLLHEGHDRKLLGGPVGDETLDEPMAHHSIADDNQSQTRRHLLLFVEGPPFLTR
jgi:hypothetical protein